MADDFGQRVEGVKLDAATFVSTDVQALPVMGTDGTNLFIIRTNGAGLLNMVATNLDIRDLSHTQDSVKIGDGSDFLAVNGDGSINVSVTGAGANSVYHTSSTNLVKNTLTTVVTRSPSATENFKAIMVSGAGMCLWQLEFGTTGGEAVILQFWTTPSHPTEYVDIPDVIDVTSTQTIRIRATNKENAASPTSDFTGYATLIRQG